MDPVQLAIFGSGVVAVAAALHTFWRKVLRDFFTGLAGAIENVNGRPAKIDKAGRQVEPAVPSLGVQLSDLRQQMRDQSEQNKRITALEVTVSAHSEALAAHAKQIADLASGHTLERSLSHVAQTRVVDAIAEANRHEANRRDATDADVVEEPDTDVVEEPDTEL